MIDDQSVLEEVRFVENNPVRWRLSSLAEDNTWSSARARVTGEQDAVLTDGFFLAAEIPDGRAYRAGREDEAVLRRARERMKTGRPSGDAEFVRTLEAVAGRRLGALPRGRPRKNYVQENLT